MADSKVSALAAASSINDADMLLLVQGGVSKRVDMNTLDAYIEQRGRQNNASVASTAAGFAADTYLVGSDVAIPAGRLQAKSMYRVKFFATKTASGAATPIIQVRFGTAGSTADTSRATLTFAAQTNVIDSAVIEIFCTFRAVGASGILRAEGMIDHTLATTGFSTANTSITGATSATFDTTVASSRIGLSVNGGSGASWTINSVQAELFNLA